MSLYGTPMCNGTITETGIQMDELKTEVRKSTTPTKNRNEHFVLLGKILPGLVVAFMLIEGCIGPGLPPLWLRLSSARACAAATERKIAQHTVIQLKSITYL